LAPAAVTRRESLGLSTRISPVKILFFVEAMGRIRYFDSVVRMLAERGHTIRVAARPKKGELRLPAALEHPSISVVECPRRRADDWSDLAGFLRTARDYARYLAPRFRGAVALRGRLRGPVADTFLRFCQEHSWVQRNWKVLTLALKLAEELIPSDEAFERFLESEHPDIVLITPLVDFIVYPTDYVKSAHKLGLPIAYLLWSWDNLTSKGMIRVIPDRAMVWNQIQKWEAVRLHGVPADRVVVTGAPRFDRFFALRPATTRVEFCEQNGLDPARPFILYLCSSDFVGHRELEFVQHWVAEIRRSPDPVLRTCGLLIRPHPATKNLWMREDLPDLPNVALQRLGPEGRERSLYDALHHAAAVVGLNTSALIEAGIVGKAVYTVVVPEFARGQEGTLHFDCCISTICCARTGAWSGRLEASRSTASSSPPRWQLDHPAVRTA
jgi:hypothetical protein